MPSETKTEPALRAASLQNTHFTFRSEQERQEGIEKAFDYRGDVTLSLANEQVEGFLYNRETRTVPHRVELFVKGDSAPRTIPYADIVAIAFTGKDTADGKSWENWVNKKETERVAEAERLRLEMAAKGLL